MIYDPYSVFEKEVEGLVKHAVKELYDLELLKIDLEEPPPGHGHLAFKCFELGRRLEIRPDVVARQLKDKIDKMKKECIERVEAERGYLNFYAHVERIAAIVGESISIVGEKYGFNPSLAPKNIIVEFLSANPVHPIHIGGARNAILGDALARLLEWRGHKVRRHFYVNDMGRQVAIAAFGYELLGRPKPWTKPDHAIGFIYATTSCLLEIKRLKEELNLARRYGKDMAYRSKVKELDEWVGVAARLRERNEEMFDRLVDSFNKEAEPERKISFIMKLYEEKDPDVVKLIREVCELCIDGFKETLSRVSIYFDSFDWESEITAWSGLTQEVIRRLEATPYVAYSKGTMIFLANEVVKDYDLGEKFGVPKGFEVPPLTLMRSDGTTLYTTRDIAYTIWKFRHANTVINVIGAEQKVAQLQLRLALVALGYKQMAENLIHLGYELVKVPGMKMSGRTGQYVTLDELLDESIRRANAEVQARSPGLPDEERKRIAEIVGIGAIKYSLLAVSPSKPVTFVWEQVLNFERNSGPFVQYAHARAHNIMVKARERGLKPHLHPEQLRDPLEKELVMMVAKWPNIVKKASDKLRPDILCEYVNDLSMVFNSFYDKLPVIRAESRELGEARLWLVNVIRVVLKNCLGILGIPAPTRM